MADKHFRYIIIGGGVAGASAVDGIREVDSEGSILLIGAERFEPYHRPPLSKQLWIGKKLVKDVFFRNTDQYDELGVRLLTGRTVLSLNAKEATITDDNGRTYGYEKLLLATGGEPHQLDIPGGDLTGVCYFRTLDDFLRTHREVTRGTKVVVIGGGFIGSEMAAALTANKADVVMLLKDSHLVPRVFPRELGLSITADFESRGVNVVSGSAVTVIETAGHRLWTHTAAGETFESDLVIAGVGIRPSVDLARQAGIVTENGILVNERLRTSAPAVYAAGDNAFFPYQVLGRRMRLEHWDNAIAQGKQAGRNMAGADEPFTYMPYFFSDLFDFGYEAVGDIDSRLETFADWSTPNQTGTVYYLADGHVRGVMLCNEWDKLADARELIMRADRVTPSELQGAIH